MIYLLLVGVLIGGLAPLVIGWLSWQLLQQNGRLLLRIEALETRLEAKTEREKQEAEADQSLPRSFTPGEAPDSPPVPERAGSVATSNGDKRADRFSSHSLASSKIKRDGLKAGTLAPEFRLPRLEGGELALSELRGRIVLLVFSSPHCGPCNLLAPKLQKFHRKNPELELVMISRESQDENRAKVKEHGLSFPVVLQKQWEVSRDYAMFATPVAYLINNAGIISADIAVGVEAVLELMKRAMMMLRQHAKAGRTPFIKRLKGWLAYDIGLGVGSRRKGSRSASSVSGSM
jgi:peroxiredoxin